MNLTQNLKAEVICLNESIWVSEGYMSADPE